MGGSSLMLRDETRHRTVATRVWRAEGMWQRLVGLMGRVALAEGEGLWLVPCNGVHTFGMREPLDIVVLDHGLRVVAMWPGVAPWRVCWPVRRGCSTVELRSGALSACGVRVGDQMALEPAAPGGGT